MKKRPITIDLQPLRDLAESWRQRGRETDLRRLHLCYLRAPLARMKLKTKARECRSHAMELEHMIEHCEGDAK